MPSDLTLLLLAVLGLAVVFDYINGFHDTANSIATSVSTRALRPEHAILMSATANFVGALTGTAVAKTISSGLATTPEGPEGQTIVAAALVGAIVWNLITWRLGIPSSSSHALIGGLLGAVVVAVGASAIKPEGVINKVILPLVMSPIIGILIGFLAMVVLLNLFQRANPRRLNDRFRRLQVVSAAFMAFSHGSNDAQKTVGVIAALLLASGATDSLAAPLWAEMASAAALTIGTALGGWRIVETIGRRIYRIRPLDGLSSQAGSSAVILGASLVGAPVSTTHVVASSVVGVGMGRRRWRHVRWVIVKEMGMAWLTTIPVTAVLGAVALAGWRWVA